MKLYAAWLKRWDSCELDPSFADHWEPHYPSAYNTWEKIEAYIRSSRLFPRVAPDGGLWWQMRHVSITRNRVLRIDWEGSKRLAKRERVLAALRILEDGL